MALGATPADLLKLILRQVLRLIAAGLVAGAILGWLLTRAISHIFHGDTGVLVFFIAAALLSVVALVACYVPARRATRVDPMIALRYE